MAALAVSSAIIAQSPVVHDPVMAKEGNTWYLYATGMGIQQMTSDDGQHWTVKREPLMTVIPEWTHDSVPGFEHHVWAPDVIRWHNRWKTLTPEDFTSIPDYTSIEVRKGYYHSTYADPAPPFLLDRYMEASEDREPLDGINRWYLKKIAATCRKQGISLVLMSMPSVKNWTSLKHNTCADLAAELDIPFVDLNEMKEEIPIDWNLDTRDRGDHLNNDGMKKVCTWLGPWLKEQYALEDHRGDPAYDETWTDMYEEYVEWIS